MAERGRFADAVFDRRRSPPLDFRGLGQGQRVVHIHAQIPNRVLDLTMPEQELDRPQVACGLVDERSLRPAQRMGTVLFRSQANGGYPLINKPRYWRVLRCPAGLARLGNAKSSTVPPRRSSQARRLVRASAVISNWTGRPVFCWITIDLARMAGPATRVPILIFTRSQPRSLLSIARSNRARSLIRSSRSRKKRIDQICLTFSARFAPTCLPAFQADLSLHRGHIEKYP
jgi:hypothetical protein